MIILSEGEFAMDLFPKNGNAKANTKKTTAKILLSKINIFFKRPVFFCSTMASFKKEISEK